MERLIALGTGNAAVTRCYNTCFIIQNDNDYFLIDTGGGNGILSALEKSKVAVEQIHHIFISHAHTDHILGIVWMIRMVGTGMNNGKYTDNLYIYCEENLIQTIKTIVKLTVQEKFYKFMDDRIIFIPVQDGDEKEILKYRIRFFDILSTKAKQFGFTTLLENGMKLSFTGDEPYKETLYNKVKDSYWLLHEAFCLFSQRERFHPYEKNHSTVKDACEIAEKLHINNLVLWHTEDKNIEKRKELYIEEGKKYFSGKLYVPDDLDIIEL